MRISRRASREAHVKYATRGGVASERKGLTKAERLATSACGHALVYNRSKQACEGCAIRSKAPTDAPLLKRSLFDKGVVCPFLIIKGKLRLAPADGTAV